jgi:hypothetical protein
MTMLCWIATGTPEGIVYSNDTAEEYEILQEDDNTYFVRRVVAECDDIGPLDSFKEAEDIVLQIGVMLVAFEEQAWKILAAQSIQARPPLDVHYFSEAVGGGDEEEAVYIIAAQKFAEAVDDAEET